MATVSTKVRIKDKRRGGRNSAKTIAIGSRQHRTIVRKSQLFIGGANIGMPFT
jgi:hypothetical protein